MCIKLHCVVLNDLLFFYTHQSTVRKKRTIAYYSVFLSNLQHNVYKFKSLKFKCLKIAEGDYKGFARVWVPSDVASLAADLHFSNTLQVKRHVNELYTSKSSNGPQGSSSIGCKPRSTTTTRCSRNHAFVLACMDVPCKPWIFQNQHPSRILAPVSTNPLA